MNGQAGWSAHCRATVLGFRAACNAVVEPSLRPVRIRVAERLSKSKEAKELFGKHWGGDEGVDAFWVSLTKDECWRTLVIEAIEQNRRWSNLLKVKPSEWGSSLLEKLRDKGHPGARAATATLATFSTLWAAHAVAPNAITLPVSLAASDRKPLTLPIKLSSDQGGEYSLKIKVDPGENPIPLRFVAGGGTQGAGTDVLQNLTDQLVISNRSLNQTATYLNKIASQPVAPELGQMQDAIAQVSKTIQSTSDKLQTIDGRLETLNATYAERADAQAKKAEVEASSVTRDLAIVALASASHNPPVQLAIAEHSSQSVVLPSFEPTSGQSSSKTITIMVGGVSGSGGSLSVPLRLSSSPNPVNSTVGDVLDLGPLPWKLTVNAIERHFFSPDIVRVTLSPEIKPI